MSPERRLTTLQVLFIRRQPAERSHADIARELKVSRSLILRVRNGERGGEGPAPIEKRGPVHFCYRHGWHPCPLVEGLCAHPRLKSSVECPRCIEAAAAWARRNLPGVRATYGS